MIEEAVAVGRACGVALAEDAADRAYSVVMSLPAEARNSMERDYQLKRRVELDRLTGAIVRLGRDLGIATPSFETLYAVLRVCALQFGGLA